MKQTGIFELLKKRMVRIHQYYERTDKNGKSLTYPESAEMILADFHNPPNQRTKQ